MPMTNELSFDTMFASAESLRSTDLNEPAVDRYTEIERLGLAITAEQQISLHHMWGVALLGISKTEEARSHLRKALDMRPDQRRWAAIDRDLSRSYLIDGNLNPAEVQIDRSLEYIPLDDLPERGISLGFKARILIAKGKTLEALEMFGTAAKLLQRGDNRHYELYNGLHFAAALVEQANLEELENLDSYFDRVRWLANTYGGESHRVRWQELVRHIRELKGLANPVS